MESDGTRVHSVPPEPRRKVLRAGVRIVAEQFAPYSDEPPEDAEGYDWARITAGSINANRITAGTITFNTGAPAVTSTALHQAMEEITKTVSAGTHATPNIFDVLAHSFKSLRQLFESATPELTLPELDGQPRDHKSKKNKPQVEPRYVKLTKPRRRR